MAASSPTPSPCDIRPCDNDTQRDVTNHITLDNDESRDDNNVLAIVTQRTIAVANDDSAADDDDDMTGDTVATQRTVCEDDVRIDSDPLQLISENENEVTPIPEAMMHGM